MNQQFSFNMSLQTLSRIDEILKDCSFYAVNNNILGYMRNLRELNKEAVGFYDKEELKKSFGFWRIINKYEKDIIMSEEKLSYDEKLIVVLDTFDIWVRILLHKKKITFSMKDAKSGLNRLDQKYGLTK